MAGEMVDCSLIPKNVKFYGVQTERKHSTTQRNSIQDKHPSMFSNIVSPSRTFGKQVHK
jgi:hypothetical protein